MTDIEFAFSSQVDLKREMADDDYVLEAMLVSTLKDDQVQKFQDADKAGKINYLMKWRHGSPFEHTFFTFRVEAPIFVFREWHRHRIGISINEASARYTVLPGKFYCPPATRPLVQTGKPGNYTFVPGTADQYDKLLAEIQENSREAYARYERLLEEGVAKEIARSVLPVNIFSQMYWTCNARSLMAFLSLRTKRDAMLTPTGEMMEGDNEMVYQVNPNGAMFPSSPQWEIDQCAQAMEAEFARLMPHTHTSFVQNGRVAP